MIRSIQRWWFRVCHPEYCYVCGGKRRFRAYEFGRGEWVCLPCEDGEMKSADELYLAQRERTEACYRELFGGRK